MIVNLHNFGGIKDNQSINQMKCLLVCMSYKVMLITFDVDGSCNVQLCGKYNQNKPR